MRLLFTFTLFIGLIYDGFSQKYPLYESPLDIPLYAAGTFGELRYNHFHSGIDIKTRQREGFEVKAVGKGFIGRIRISHGSYGKALYIHHPEGYITVYGHLKKFAPKIETYIKALQYKKKTYTINHIPKKDSITIRKGELIAYSGNTGGSFAPHLHFEVRKTIGQVPMNPMLFGIKIKDSKAPIIKALYGYALDRESQINGFTHPIQINFIKQKNGILLADPISAFGDIGFGIVSYDKQDETKNKNGVYKTSIKVNGSPFFEYIFNSIPFSESQYINTFIDYEKYILEKTKIQKCFITQGNILGIYTKRVYDGILNIIEGFSYKVEISISDFKKNTTRLVIPIEGRLEHIIPPIVKQKGVLIKPLKDYSFKLKDALIYFPPNTFFEKFYAIVDQFDDTFKIHNNTTPVKNEYDFIVDVSHYNTTIQDKLFLAYETEKDIRYQNAVLKKHKLYAHPRVLGDFKVMMDTISPVITVENFKKNTPLEKGLEHLIFKTSDDLSGVKTYQGLINKKWILLEYDYKKETLIYDLSDLKYDSEELKIQITVEDKVGNQQILNTSIFYPKK